MPLREDWRNYGITLSKLIARAWADPEFHEHLVQDPSAVLKQAGLEIPEGVEVAVDQSPEANWRIVPSAADPETALYIVPLPPRPARLTDAELRTWVQQAQDSPGGRRVPVVCCS